MIAADGNRFTEILLALSECYDKPVSDTRAAMYFEALADLSIDDVASAAAQWMRAGKWFPKPVELREQLTGSVEDEAEIAWAAFQREVSRVGYMRRPSLPEVTMATVRIVFGDWRSACASLPSPDSERAPELMGWRKQFLHAYGVARHRESCGDLTTGEAKSILADITAYRQKQLRGEASCLRLWDTLSQSAPDAVCGLRGSARERASARADAGYADTARGDAGRSAVG